MSAKEFLKEKDLLLNSIEKNTVEHWENYYSNVPIKCIFEDLVIDINEIKRLTEENQELKNQLETLEKTNNQLISKLDRYDAIVDERDELKKQLEDMTLCRDIASGHRKEVQNRETILLNQQKEFIDYLEDEKDRLVRECNNICEDKFDEADDILQKYKEIIGGKDE